MEGAKLETTIQMIKALAENRAGNILAVAIVEIAKRLYKPFLFIIMKHGIILVI